MMRKTVTALGLVLCLGTGLPHAQDKNAKETAAERLTRTFESICLQTLPHLAGAAERLKAGGFELTPLGDQEMYELWNESMKMGGHLHLAQGDRKPLVEALLADWLGKKPVRWETNDPYMAGWQVPAGGSVLYISVATSLSDNPTQGASVNVEER
jgi:hypothetical protein